MGNRLVSLKEVCSSIDYGHTTSASEFPVGPKFLRITDIAARMLDWAFVPFCKIDDHLLEKYRLKHGDIVIARTGASTGASAYIQNPPEAVFASYLVRYQVDPKKADAKFVSYVLKSKKFQEFIHSVLGDKSAQPNASAATMAEFKFESPSLSDQKRCAEVLRNLDDKITLNHHTNATLEAMARALFKSWFIDFDPVRAKAAGKKTGLPKEIEKLFPGKLVKTELGEVPEGWEIGSVSDIGEIVCGKTPSTRNPENFGNEIPFITIPDMHGKVFSINTARKLSLAGEATQKGKTIPAGSICVSCIATTGLTIITTTASQTNQQINSVIPANLHESIFWYWILRDLGIEIQAAGSGGSVLSNLSTSRFAGLRVLFPPRELREKYAAAMRSNFDKILSNENEVHTISAIRDALLPELVS